MYRERDIYIYIYRERECTYLVIYIFVYIYIYIYIYTCCICVCARIPLKTRHFTELVMDWMIRRSSLKAFMTLLCVYDMYCCVVVV